jgi:hypothetical protein
MTEEKKAPKLADINFGENPPIRVAAPERTGSASYRASTLLVASNLSLAAAAAYAIREEVDQLKETKKQLELKLKAELDQNEKIRLVIEYLQTH